MKTRAKARPNAILLAFYAVCAAAFATALLSLVSDVIAGDTYLYHQYASAMVHGALPYKDIAVEYPPGVLPFMLLALPLGNLIGSYATGFLLLVSIVAFFLCWDILKTWGLKRFALSAFFLLLFGELIFYLLDFFAIAAVYTAIRTLRTKRYNWSAILIGLAILIKAYPVLCLPALIFALPRTKIKSYLRTLGLTLAIGLLPFLLISPKGLWNAVLYHADRPAQAESLPAAVGYVLHAFGQPIKLVGANKSIAAEFSQAGLLAAICTLLLAVTLVLAVVYMWRKGNHRMIGLNMLVPSLLFILLFKVGSDQYILLPLILMLFVAQEVQHKQAVLWVFVLIGLGMRYLLSFDYFGESHSSLQSDALLVIGRIILEAWLLYWALKHTGWLRRKAPPEHTT